MNQESIDYDKLKKAELIELIKSSNFVQERTMAKVTIEKFNGVDDDMDACDWIQLYDILADDANWSDKTKINHLPSYLRGLAVKWYFNEINGNILDWITVKELFETNFGQNDKPSLMAINNTKWDSNKESLTKYYQNKLTMCSRAGLKGRLLLDTLTDGLPNELKIHVQTLSPDSKPQTWFNLVQRAVDLDNQSKPKDAKKLKNEINAVIEQEYVKRSEIQDFRNELKEIKLLINNFAKDRQSFSNTGPKCTHCGKQNHQSDRCFKIIGYPSRKKNEQTKQVNNLSEEASSICELNDLEINKIEAKIHSDENYQDKHELKFLRVSINDKLETLALIDSGSSVTAIDYKLCLKNNFQIERSTLTLAGATNIFESQGTTKIRLRNGCSEVELSAVVMNLVRQDIIIGTPDFKYFGIELTGPNLVSKLQSEQIPSINSVEIEKQSSARLDVLRENYKKVFGQHNFHVGVCRLIKCRIILEPNAKPIEAKPRKLSLALQKEEERQVQELLKHKLIRNSFSSWASGVTFAVREGKMPRLCGDYRYLNLKTISDQYPIPNIENIILQFKGAKVYSTLDVVRGYNHIEIETQDRYLTFTTNVGLFEWNRMPFGLKNAPSIFQRLMNRILQNHKGYAKAYFDDIVIFSQSIDDHLEHLKAVFETLIGFNIKLNKDKCKFMNEKVSFCGYQIAKDKIGRDYKYIEAIRQISKPTNLQELQSFLGLANYGSRFVQNYAELCKPLNNLRKKDATWLWKEEEDNAFRKLKEVLESCPKLYLFKNDLETVLYCDASKYVIAGVLTQGRAECRIIGYYSKTLTNAQINYNIYTKELLAIVKSVEFFKQMLYGKQFTVVTDNSALAFFRSSKQVFDKYTRWLLFLEEFDIKIELIRGNKNILADAITRLKREENTITTIDKQALNEETMLEKFKEVHTQQTNHSGFMKMKEVLKQNYTIVDLDLHLRRYLDNCDACNKVNQHVKRSGYYHPKPPGKPNSRWHSDILGPFPASKKFTNVLVIVDHTTRFAQTYLMITITTSDIVKSLQKSFQEFGRPLSLVTDNGPAYISHEFKKFLTDCEVEQIITPAHHSAANGLAERFNKTMREAMIKYMLNNPNIEWSDLVAKIVDRYNNTKHRVTGYTPNELLQSNELWKIANERTIKQQTYDAKRLNQKRKPAQVEVGSKVLLDNPKRFQKKFAPKRLGPFTVLKKINNEIYVTNKKLSKSGKGYAVHSKDLKTCP